MTELTEQEWERTFTNVPRVREAYQLDAEFRAHLHATRIALDVADEAMVAAGIPYEVRQRIVDGATVTFVRDAEFAMRRVRDAQQRARELAEQA